LQTTFKIIAQNLLTRKKIGVLVLNCVVAILLC